MTDKKDAVIHAGPPKAKKIITPHKECDKGCHTFIPSKSTITGSAHKVVHMICQHCLMPIELNENSKDWVVASEWLKEKD